MKAKPLPGIPYGGPVPRLIEIPCAGALEAAGVSAERPNDQWVYYKGTKAALVAAGILADGWFPGDPGRNKTMIGFRKLRGLYGHAPDRRDPGAIDQVRRCSRDRFEVMRETTDAELTEHAVRDAAREKLQRARAMESASVEAMTSSREEFRERVQHALLVARYVARSADGGYSFDEDTWEAFHEALSEVETIVAAGVVEFSSARRAAKIAEIKAETAKADTGLQSFLKGIVDNHHDPMTADEGHAEAQGRPGA
jgi:hypothetical protein